MKYKLLSILLICFSLTSYAQDNWLTSFEEAKVMALNTNKLVLVDFWAVWCGPCKRMDSESWKKEEVKELMNSYVPVKINIDSNRDIAQKYGVNGIPYIFIMDGNGKVLYHQMSYQRRNELMGLLKKYALSTEILRDELINFYNKENFGTAFQVAAKYQDYGLIIGDSIKKDFLKMAARYFSISKDYLKKSKLGNKNAFEQKLELYQIQEELILNNPSKALRQLSKLNPAEVDTTNQSFYDFLHYVAYKELQDDDNISLFESKLSEAEKTKARLFVKHI